MDKGHARIVTLDPTQPNLRGSEIIIYRSPGSILDTSIGGYHSSVLLLGYYTLQEEHLSSSVRTSRKSRFFQKCLRVSARSLSSLPLIPI